MFQNEFATYIAEDLLASILGVYLRRMFSGFGLYKDGVMAGLIVGDELFLKVDESNQIEYEAMGSIPFSYERKDGKTVALSYWKIPADVLENTDVLVRLFEISYTINLKKATRG